MFNTSNCNTCGHKENPKTGWFCFLKENQPRENTCIMWVQGVELDYDFVKMMGDFFDKEPRKN